MDDVAVWPVMFACLFLTDFRCGLQGSDSFRGRVSRRNWAAHTLFAALWQVCMLSVNSLVLIVENRVGTGQNAFLGAGLTLRAFAELENSLQHVFFNKTSENQLHKDNGDSGTQNGRPQRKAKPTVPLRNWKILFNTFFSTRRQKMNSTKVPARKTKTEIGSRGGQNPPYLYGIRKFSSTLPQLPATTPRHNSRYTSPAPTVGATFPPRQ